MHKAFYSVRYFEDETESLDAGRAGTVGRILQRGLSAEYDVVVSDLPEEASPVAGATCALISQSMRTWSIVSTWNRRSDQSSGPFCEGQHSRAGTLDQMGVPVRQRSHNVLSASIRLGIKRVDYGQL